MSRLEFFGFHSRALDIASIPLLVNPIVVSAPILHARGNPICLCIRGNNTPVLPYYVLLSQQYGSKQGCLILSVLRSVIRFGCSIRRTATQHMVRCCARARDCVWLCWDTSRNRSRRWCDMKDCGNRSKARLFYERKRGVDE